MAKKTKQPTNNEGGYEERTKHRREHAHHSFDPALGFDPLSAIYDWVKGNRSRGEENEYYKAYLGLDNNVPRTNTRLQGLEADEKFEDRGEYYGTTDTMDRNIQVYADTARVKTLIDEYDKYKDQHNLSKAQLERIYKQGKELMEHPNEFVQMNADTAPGFEYNKNIRTTNESNPLGMLARFGARWRPEEGVIEVHDAYDFPRWVTALSSIPVRPKVMRIRGRIKYDPKKGSVLLRDKVTPQSVDAKRLLNGGLLTNISQSYGRRGVQG